MTNRDLYLSVTELVARHADSHRSLEEFLRALRAALEPHLSQPSMTPDQFVGALDAAFSGPVPDRDPAWRRQDLSDDHETPVDAATVDRILRSQALDMEDAESGGALRDEMRGLGRSVGRPDGAVRASDGYFYNWHPQAFVECGVAGAFGGWEPGDDTGRMLVPGEVAVQTKDGIVSVPAEKVERPVIELPELTWAQVADFLWSGQHYE